MVAPLPTYPKWVIDGSPIDDPLGHGERAVRFLHQLRHPKAPDGRFRLDPWMERIIRRVYGPRHPDGTRIVKNVFAMLPRGNRKTTLGAALTLLHLVGPERSPGGQLIAAAVDQRQARIAFDEAASIIRADRRLEPIVQVHDYRNRAVSQRDKSVLEALSSDGATQHGRTPTFALLDEIHAWKKFDLYEAIRTGLVKTPGSLQVILTTAGRGQTNIGFSLYDYARRVALGEIDDPATLPVILEAPADADWTDEAVWHLVNPGLSCTPPYPDLAGLRQLAREAQNRPADRESFRQLHMNVWLDGSADPFVDMATYDAGAESFDEDELRTLPCWIGVDLSKTTDLTAVVACFKRDTGELLVKPFFFCPGDQLRARADRDKVPYPQWADEGHLTATPGNVVDFHEVEQCIRDLCDRYSVQEIAVDPWQARPITVPLAESGLPVFEHRQGMRSMAPAVAALERAIVGGMFKHDGNPVLRWNFANIAVEVDKAGNMQFHKGKSRERIDGAVAAAMAVGRASSGDLAGSIYTSDRPEGLLFI